jgi:hypothetical protein
MVSIDDKFKLMGRPVGKQQLSIDRQKNSRSISHTRNARAIRNSIVARRQARISLWAL